MYAKYVKLNIAKVHHVHNHVAVVCCGFAHSIIYEEENKVKKIVEKLRLLI